MYSNNTELIQLVKSVLESIDNAYDKDGFSYLKRSPTGEIENAKTLQEFIEDRFNYDAFYIPEISDLVKYFDGHLFSVISLEGLKEKKKRFNRVYLQLSETDEYFIQDPDKELDYREVLDEIKNYLGGTKISFGDSKKKIKILIE